MKTINFQEFHRMMDFIQSQIVSAQLQEINHFETGIVLTFYRTKLFWLVIDLSPQPIMLLFEKDIPPVTKSQKPKPLTLFMKSHFKNLRLEEVRYQLDWGRRALFFFSKLPSENFVEIILVPNHSNIICTSGQKKISWNKPQELALTISERNNEVDEFRAPQVLLDEWLREIKSSTRELKDGRKIWELKTQKTILKKTNAITKIRESLEENQEQTYYQIGEFLKYYSLEELPKEWIKFVDLKKTKNWNRENIFQKAKGIENKRLGAELRINSLLKEIEALEKETYEDSLKKVKHNISPIKSSTLLLRKLEVSAQAIAYLGKNAKDNVQLLKQSQPWDLWFHLKDYPSSFVIVRRNKNYNLNSKELSKIVDWYVKETYRTKKEVSLMDFDVIYTECRFVKTIKGDKMGRVTYSHEKSYRWRGSQ